MCHIILQIIQFVFRKFTIINLFHLLIFTNQNIDVMFYYMSKL